MAKYRLDPETKKHEDLYEVSIREDELTIRLPHVGEYVQALNDARDLRQEVDRLRKRIDAVGPNLRRIRHFLTAMDGALPPRSHYESKEHFALVAMINDIDEILRGR